MVLLACAPAVWLSAHHVHWVVWVPPLLVVGYLVQRHWSGDPPPIRLELEEPPAFCLAFDQDVPLQERWQVAIRRWRMAMDALPEGVVLLDYRLAICWFNPGAHQLLGLDESRDLGKPLGYRLGQPVLEDFLLRGDFSRSVDLPSPLDGGRMLHWRFIRLTGEEFWMVLVHDITERYQLDRQQNDFISNISHELKTPITVFRGVVELLPDLTTGSAAWDNALNLLHQQIRRMQNLIEDQTQLLRLGPRHTFPSESIHMESFIREMIAEAEMLSGERGHQFVFTVARKFPFHANRELVRCVVNNLFSNAVHHTPDQTEVQVSWEVDEMQRPTLTVADNGPGIASYHLPRLTEKYYRVTSQQSLKGASQDYQGTGLGLALVKEAMERAHGKLEIISQAGIGSRFMCRFPPVVVDWIEKTH
ncbi:MAG: PAS domain-containing protein [Magnetococcales bacterium]|nr:PAS domain-containing protein [Magnetococcales bacterium]NGZ05300.1 PAS domain-containing protein [Magnetococcales bacterium]